MSDPFAEGVVQPLSSGNSKKNNNKSKRAKKAQLGGGGDAFPSEQQKQQKQQPEPEIKIASATSGIPNINGDDDDQMADSASMLMDDHITVASSSAVTTRTRDHRSDQKNKNTNDDDDDNVATVLSDTDDTNNNNNNNNDDDDNVNNENVAIIVEQHENNEKSNTNNNNNNNNKSTAGNPVPVIARSVGMPLIVSWVTAYSTKKGTAMITGHYTIKTGIKLGDASAQEQVFEVKRSLMDLLQFRLAYMQTKPYIYIGDLPPEDTMKQDADEVLAFVHIIVNNPALCDSVLTWHLLTVPQEELKTIGLPSGFSVFKTVMFGSGSFFGPTEIPTQEQLKIEVISPQIVGNENLRNEIFRVLDLVGEACELARGFSYSRVKFNQRAVHWERLRVACVDMVNSHKALNEASSMFESALRDVACDGALFWPWTMNQTLADEKLRIENDIKKQEKRKLAASQQNSSTNFNNTTSTTNYDENDDADENVYLSVATTDSEKYRKTPHPTIQLGKGFLNAANLTENICKQTVALDLQNLMTVVTLMTKVDFACAQSSVQADEYFRNSSEELKLIHTLLKTIKDLASASGFDEATLRSQLSEIGNAATIISKRVTEMQADLRRQMQSVRAATHFHVLTEVERWVTGQRFTWTGAALLASEIKKRLHCELDGVPVENSNSSSGINMAITKNQIPSIRDEQFFSESLPMFEVEAGKQKKEISFGPPVLDDLSLAFNLGDSRSQGSPTATAAANSNNNQNNSSSSGTGFSVFGKKFFGNSSSPESNKSKNKEGEQNKRVARHALQQPNEDSTMMMSTVTVGNNSNSNSTSNGPRRERAAARTSVVNSALLDDPFARI